MFEAQIGETPHIAETWKQKRGEQIIWIDVHSSQYKAELLLLCSGRKNHSRWLREQRQLEVVIVQKSDLFSSLLEHMRTLGYVMTQ